VRLRITHFFTTIMVSQLEPHLLLLKKDGGSVINRKNTPILVVYAFIDRHYILDLLPEVSVIGSLLKSGLDIFATDWGTPSAI